MQILIFVGVLLFLIIIHELGHFFTALWCKVNVLEFGIGIPPKVKTLFSFKGIPFTLNALPFGGFVRMEGEGESENGETPRQPGTVSLRELPLPKKLLVVLSGATINFLFGILAFTIIFSIVGIPVKSPFVKVSGVSPNSPAEMVGLRANDEIKAVQTDNQTVTITDQDQFVALVKEQKGKSITLEISRDGTVQQIPVTVRTDDQIPAGDGALGVGLTSETLQRFAWYEMPFRAMLVGIDQSVQFGWLILRSLGTMVGDLASKGTVPTDVAGPIGIAYQVEKQDLFSAGPLAILNFAAMLSVNLAIMNVLPIPALDGGRAFFMLIEKLFPKSKRVQIEQIFNNVGFTLLIGLLILITFKDVVQIIRP
ncbi:site-2 protease family protein [Candidatus Woesebacteria bacterium]|nr:site-2 protease family protein [Candidatus Woesebacteria bacterium]